jgi:hypothetical protein
MQWMVCFLSIKIISNAEKLMTVPSRVDQIDGDAEQLMSVPFIF